eukprot:m.5987 g.5987  ORF g.5987 m.5987 type:complete len:77 (-) comp4564_c0_seq1:1-231(-)
MSAEGQRVAVGLDVGTTAVKLVVLSHPHRPPEQKSGDNSADEPSERKEGEERAQQQEPSPLSTRCSSSLSQQQQQQ